MAYTGIDGLRAYKVMATLVRSLFFIAEVVAECAKATQTKPEDMTFEVFLGWFDSLESDRKRGLFKLSVIHGALLDPDEIFSLLKYRKDKNGVSISKTNIGNLSVKEIADSITDVCMELSEETIFF